jgi:hypothetical protein
MTKQSARAILQIALKRFGSRGWNCHLFYQYTIFVIAFTPTVYYIELNGSMTNSMGKESKKS